MTKLLYLIITVVAIAVGAFVFNKTQVLPQPEHALYYKESRDIKPFEMADHQGNTFNNESFTGHWSLVFFGYTSCPDVCPTTLQEFNFSYPAIKKIASNSQVLLVSVDPKRDTQDRLAQYIAYFNKEFLALRAGHEVLFPFARNLGLMYAITDADDGQATQDDNYLVDHSASIVLINPQGRIASIFKPQHQLGQLPTINFEYLVSDFAKIVSLQQEK